MHQSASQIAVKRVVPRAETRIASYLLTEYLERLGVEVIFGLCGHTVIGFLDALGKSRIRFISTRHEQIAAHAADGYARASGKVGVLMTQYMVSFELPDKDFQVLAYQALLD